MDYAEVGEEEPEGNEGNDGSASQTASVGWTNQKAKNTILTTLRGTPTQRAIRDKNQTPSLQVHLKETAVQAKKIMYQLMSIR